MSICVWLARKEPRLQLRAQCSQLFLFRIDWEKCFSFMINFIKLRQRKRKNTKINNKIIHSIRRQKTKPDGFFHKKFERVKVQNDNDKKNERRKMIAKANGVADNNHITNNIYASTLATCGIPQFGLFFSLNSLNWMSSDEPTTFQSVWLFARALLLISYNTKEETNWWKWNDLRNDINNTSNNNSSAPTAMANKYIENKTCAAITNYFKYLNKIYLFHSMRRLHIMWE